MQYQTRNHAQMGMNTLAAASRTAASMDKEKPKRKSTAGDYINAGVSTVALYKEGKEQFFGKDGLFSGKEGPDNALEAGNNPEGLVNKVAPGQNSSGPMAVNTSEQGTRFNQHEVSGTPETPSGVSAPTPEAGAINSARGGVKPTSTPLGGSPKGGQELEGVKSVQAGQQPTPGTMPSANAGTMPTAHSGSAAGAASGSNPAAQVTTSTGGSALMAADKTAKADKAVTTAKAAKEGGTVVADGAPAVSGAETGAVEGVGALEKAAGSTVGTATAAGTGTMTTAGVTGATGGIAGGVTGGVGGAGLGTAAGTVGTASAGAGTGAAAGTAAATGASMGPVGWVGLAALAIGSLLFAS